MNWEINSTTEIIIGETAVNYLIRNMGIEKLASQLDLTNTDAQDFHETVMDIMAAAREMEQDQLKSAFEKGKFYNIIKHN